MVCSLLDRWGMQGFEEHVKGWVSSIACCYNDWVYSYAYGCHVDPILHCVHRVVNFYKSQKDAMIKAAEKWLTGDYIVFDWTTKGAHFMLWSHIQSNAMRMQQCITGLPSSESFDQQTVFWATSRMVELPAVNWIMFAKASMLLRFLFLLSKIKYLCGTVFWLTVL